MSRCLIFRPLVSALLAVLVAAGPFVLPHSAVQAAVVDAEFTRLSGPTRFSTAVRIAEAYMDLVDEQPGESRVDTVILGSGLDQHFGWVAPVPRLSKLNRAPLVFTRPDEVPVPVAEFLQRRHVRKVILLGGTGVISADVEDQLDQLGVEVVERLGSDDVHDHAIAVAESIDHPAGDFAAKGQTALLSTSTVFADSLAAGPMAYQGEYPILLTPSDQLHPAVFDYLVASDIENLIILGGTAAVGRATQQALAGLDFTITRIAGADRYDTAVKLAEAQLDKDGFRPCFDGAELGLAYGGLSPDAIASGPLLGEQCAPLLLSASDVLPRKVASFLRSDEYMTGDADNDLSVTVFGGTEVVPPDVVTQFFERATTLVPIGGRIGVELDVVLETADEFTVGLNSTIDSKKAARAVELAMFTVNHERVFPTPAGDCALTATGLEPDLLYGCVRIRGSTLVVELSRPLKVDDLVTVTGGQRIGPNNSPRPVARFSYIVREPDEPIDRDAPGVEVIAPAGHNQIAVLVIEENPLNPPVLAPAELADRVTVVAADGTTKSVSDATGPTVGPAGSRGKHQRYLFNLLPDGTTLEPGDAITVSRAAFLDEDGRASPQQRHVVRDHSVDLRIESVTIGDVDSRNQASVTLSASTQPNATPDGSLTVTARSDGVAAGNRGNNWRIYGVDLTITDDQDEDTESIDDEDVEPRIEVTVSRTTRLIQYRIHAGEPIFADLAEALAAHRDFAENFIVSIDDTARTAEDDSGTIGGTAAAGRQLSGGGTAVGIRIRFSDPVREVVEPDNFVSGEGCVRYALVSQIATGLNATRGDGCTLSFHEPDNIVFLLINSSSATRLPESGDLVFITGNAARDYNGDPGRPNIAQGWLSIRYDPDVAAD